MTFRHLIMLSLWLLASVCSKPVSNDANRDPTPSAAPTPATPAAPPPTPAPPRSAMDTFIARQYYKLQDVKAGDVLNVRQQPDPAAAAIGTLVPDRAPVLWTGTSAIVGKATWWRIAAPDVEGWVNARFLAPAERTDAETPALVCFGNEPFWSLEVAADGRSACKASCETSLPLRSVLKAETEGRWTIAVTTEPGAPFMSGAISAQGCSDGMSDFGHFLKVNLERASGGLFDGCCRFAFGAYGQN